MYYPLKSAVSAIWKVYVWTFLLGAVLTASVLWIIRKNMIRPLHELENGLWSVVRSWPSWAEPERLACRLEAEQKKLQIVLEFGFCIPQQFG